MAHAKSFGISSPGFRVKKCHLYTGILVYTLLFVQRRLTKLRVVTCSRAKYPETLERRSVQHLEGTTSIARHLR